MSTATGVMLPASFQTIPQVSDQQAQPFEGDYQGAIAEVRNLYVLPSDSSALDFLNDHPALPQLLIDASPQLKKYFGDTVFALRVSSDEDGWETLFADALWSGDAREALLLLDRFEDEWGIPNWQPARGSLIFTYRLV